MTTTDKTTIKPTDRPHINPLYMFRWEEPEQSYLLLYPEGIIKLNNSAGNILELCTGDKTVDRIIAELEQRFEAEGLGDDVYKFMEASLDNGWIQLEA